MLKHIFRENHTQSNWAQRGAKGERGGQLRLHIWKIFLLVRSAGAGKGFPREREATHGWRRRKLDEARARREPWQEQELFDIVGAVFQLLRGDLESCPRHFSCLAHGDVYGFPVKKDRLKEGGETTGGVLHAPWLGAQRGARRSQAQRAQTSVTPRKGDLQAAPASRVFPVVRKKARNGYFVRIPSVYCKQNAKYCVNCKRKPKETKIQVNV